MRHRTFIPSALVLLTTPILAACGDKNGDDGTGPGVEGTPTGCIISEVCNGASAGAVDGWVSGGVNEAVSGRADFVEEADGSWVLGMGADAAGESGIFLTGRGGPPAPGTYALGDASAELAAFYVHGASDDSYVAEEGELIVVQSSPSTVAGAFEFTASDEAGNQVTVEGTFNAPRKQGGVTIGGEPATAGTEAS